MSLQELTVQGLRSFVPHTKVTKSPCKRVKIDVGLKCNLHCVFCYYREHLKENFKPLESIKENVLSLYQCGFREFDLSGGECTLHPQFFEVLDFIQGLGASASIVSNGWKFKNQEFCQECWNHGLREILFSLHGTKEVHNQITGNPKSWDYCVQGIWNCKELGYRARVNCTLLDLNYGCLSEYIDLINKIKPLEVNFILFNYNDDQKNTQSIHLKDICLELDNCLDDLDSKIICRVRYVPFCYLKHRDLVFNYYQHIWDRWDWNPLYSYTSYREPFLNDQDLVLKNLDFLKLTHHLYIKKKECLQCKYFYVCDGLKRNERKLEVYPIPGRKILD